MHMSHYLIRLLNKISLDASKRIFLTLKSSVKENTYMTYNMNILI